MKAHPEQERFGEASYHSCAVPLLSLHETPAPSLPGAGDAKRTDGFPVALTCKDVPVGRYLPLPERTVLAPNLHHFPTIGRPRRTCRVQRAPLLSRDASFFSRGALFCVTVTSTRKPASAGEAGLGLRATSRRLRNPAGSWGRPDPWGLGWREPRALASPRVPARLRALPRTGARS